MGQVVHELLIDSQRKAEKQQQRIQGHIREACPELQQALLTSQDKSQGYSGNEYSDNRQHFFAFFSTLLVKVCHKKKENF
jgi:hypothetical protein